MILFFEIIFVSITGIQFWLMFWVIWIDSNTMRKMPKPIWFARCSKETIANEDEIKNTCLDKVNPWIKEIDSTINQFLKNPHLDAYPFNDFRDVHILPHEGINPHRLRTGKNVLESEMVQVFGPVRGRSGYSFVNVHDDKVLDRIRVLYLMVYGQACIK
jgi:hypothetical protein